jgi:hypothetical protein
MGALNGRWSYRSFCPLAATDKFPAQIAGPWTRVLVMELATEGDKVSGSAAIGPGASLRINGSVTPAVLDAPGGRELLPEGVELVVDGVAGAVYNLRGFFTPGSDHIVGTVVAVSNDLGRQPVGTSGPFVLFPVRAS